MDRRASVTALLVALLTLSLATAAAGAPTSPQQAAISAPYRAGGLIVGFRPGTSQAVVAELTGRVGAVSSSVLSPLATDARVLTLGSAISVPQAIEALIGNSAVAFVEPDYLLQPIASSSDPSFLNGTLWGMYGATTSPTNQFGSNAAKAWDTSTGSRNVVVGIIDEGYQYAHPDLLANAGTNPGEIAGNRIDDDRNGYVDDVYGWDFYNGDSTVYDGGSRGQSDTHGTHVAGTIGGVGNNGIGVVGVNWSVRMMDAKFLGSRGGSLTNAIRAIDYFVALKTRATNPVNIVALNNSWGGGGYSTALLAAINRAGDAGILFVVAAGNSTINNDLTPSYPASYQCTTPTRAWDCVISVAAIDSAGRLATFSNYGATSVDLGAPGVSIYSTYPSNKYSTLSGTSMATPHVTGAIALCLAINPALSPERVRTAVLSSVAATTSLVGKTVTGGRLDVGAMAAACRAV